MGIFGFGYFPFSKFLSLFLLEMPYFRPKMPSGWSKMLYFWSTMLYVSPERLYFCLKIKIFVKLTIVFATSLLFVFVLMEFVGICNYLVL